jgi:membrane-associated HD superfamily phosphohydrolase
LEANYKFFAWLLIILSFNYLALFVLETVLPGFVMNFFNLNFLLLLVLAGWLFLAVFTKDKKRVDLGGRISTILLMLFLGLLGVGLLFSLYKADFLEIAIYFILAVVAGKLVFDHWKEKENK